jgi:hypothetical protein
VRGSPQNRPRGHRWRRTWLYRYLEFCFRFRRYQVTVIIGGFVTAVGVFVIGAIIALCTGFGPVYFKTWPIYIGLGGISWVTFWGGWADRNLRWAFRTVDKAFVAQREVMGELDRARRALFSNRRYFLSSLVVLALVLWYVKLRLFAEGHQPLDSFPSQWSSGKHRYGEFTVLALFAAPIVLLCMTMILGALSYLRLVWRLSGYELALPLEASRIRLKALASWGLKCGTGWSFALFTLVLFFGSSIGRFSDTKGIVATVVFIVLGVWAPLLFIWPQTCFYVAFRRANDAVVCETLRKRPKPSRHLKAVSINYNAYVGAALRDSGISAFEKEVDRAASGPTWVNASPAELLWWVGEIVLPILALLLKQ